MQKEKIKKPRKKYFRPTVARFNTEECKCILKHMTLARSGGLTFDKDWADTKMYYRIKARLEDRIEKEERRNANGGGDQTGPGNEQGSVGISEVTSKEGSRS